MFWRRPKSPQIEHISSVHTLASQLGVDRRRNPRVRYHSGPNAILPAFEFQGARLSVFDLSSGGCCLLDPGEVMGPSVGQDIDLYVIWPNARELVRARIVARVDHRRHIQFLDMKPFRIEQIKALIIPGLRGAGMHAMIQATSDGPGLNAREIWSSLQGDAVTLEDDVHRHAQIYLSGATLTVHKESWPSKRDGTSVTPAEMEALLLFLANIPNPSPALTDLIRSLTYLMAEART